MFTDEQLQFWGDYFVCNGLSRHGLTFERFMQQPAALAQWFRRCPDAECPLLSRRVFDCRLRLVSAEGPSRRG